VRPQKVQASGLGYVEGTVTDMLRHIVGLECAALEAKTPERVQLGRCHSLVSALVRSIECLKDVVCLHFVLLHSY